MKHKAGIMQSVKDTIRPSVENKFTLMFLSQLNCWRYSSFTVVFTAALDYQGQGAQDVRLCFHTAPGLCKEISLFMYIYVKYRLRFTDS